MGYLDVKYAAGTAVGNRLTGGMHCTREEEEEGGGGQHLRRESAKQKRPKSLFQFLLGQFNHWNWKSSRQLFWIYSQTDIFLKGPSDNLVYNVQRTSVLKQSYWISPLDSF